MADYQLQASKFYKKVDFTSTGVIAPTEGHELRGEHKLNITVEGVNATDVLYFVADTDTNNTTISCRFSVVDYKIY